MQQRNNYARNFSTRTPEGGAAGFQGNNGAQAGAECSQCGWTHPLGRCRADRRVVYVTELGILHECAEQSDSCETDVSAGRTWKRTT